MNNLLESVVRNQVREAQVTEHVEAERYARNEDRPSYRNESHLCALTTRVGTITLKVPRLRYRHLLPTPATSVFTK